MSEKAEVIQLYKEVGETPLECLYRYRNSNPTYRDSKMTYLGRLDPMAEGVMLVLVGDTRDKKKYLDLDKTYEFEVLWGLATDTYDVLGVVTAEGKQPQKLDYKMPAIIKYLESRKTQQYPPYSSRTVGGKQLFEWARENKIGEIDVPERGMKVFSALHLHTRYATGEEIMENIKARIALVQGDFRQKEIMKKWDSILLPISNDKFLISKFSADVSSGTYIRSLAHDLGHHLDTVALTYSIKRIRVGKYKL